MTTFIQYLEELADAERVITIPADELDLLVGRFGDRVRHMGRWNAGGDGSLEIPIVVIRDAASQMGRHGLVEAVQELKTGQFTRMLESSSAVSLIEKGSEAYRRYFRELMTRYQNTKDPSETARLRDLLVREVFGE